MKDLGDLHYFLGMQVTRTPRGFFLSQQRYAEDVLERAGMTKCKPASTPIDTHSKLSSQDGAPLDDCSSYRSLVGALQYLTMTRPGLVISGAASVPPHARATGCSPCLGEADFALHSWHHAPGSTSGQGVLPRRLGRLPGHPPVDFRLPRLHRRLCDLVVIQETAHCISFKRRGGVSGYCQRSRRMRCWIRELLRELGCHIPKATVPVCCDNVSAVYMYAKTEAECWSMR